MNVSFRPPRAKWAAVGSGSIRSGVVFSRGTLFSGGWVGEKPDCGPSYSALAGLAWNSISFPTFSSTVLFLFLSTHTDWKKVGLNPIFLQEFRTCFLPLKSTNNPRNFAITGSPRRKPPRRRRPSTALVVDPAGVNSI